MPDYQILLPSKPRIVKEDEKSGTYEIEGLYPGYGHTLGNSLRRIILSSLPGGAITSVKIEGVPHEFETIEGVKEDVISILLNLKKLRFKISTDEPQTITLSVKGQKDVTGVDLKLPGQIEILNPEQHIASITNKNTNLDIEMRVEKGLGYMARESLQKDKTDIGVIALDAAFAPIKRANYEVENMRVGDRTDYNKLKISIETDGTISPHEAFEQSIEIMINQLKAIIGFKEEEIMEEEAPTTSEQASESKEVDSDVLKTRIENLELSTRTANALDTANIRTIGGLVRKKEDDILALEGLGDKGVQEIKEALEKLGVTLKAQ